MVAQKVTLRGFRNAYFGQVGKRYWDDRMALGEIQQIVVIITNTDVAAVLSGADRIESRKNSSHLLDKDLIRRRYNQDTIFGEMVAKGPEQTAIVDQVLDDL